MSSSTSRLSIAILTMSLTIAGATGTAAAERGSGEALEALLAHVPATQREQCRPDLGDDPDDSLMSVSCELPSGINIRYTQEASTEAMQIRFADRVAIAAVEPDSGECDAATPGEGSYSIAGETGGRYVCYESLGYPSIHWTHEPTGIYSQAFLDGDVAELWSWWSSESGPIMPSAEVPATGLGDALDALMGRVPEAHRATCLPFDGGGPEEGVVVSVRCEVADDLSAYYHQYESVEALEAAYTQELERAGVERDGGDCSTEVPGEGGYTIAGEPAGRVSCGEFFDSIELSWTHEPTAIGATVFAERDLAALWQWWLSESGPVEPSS